MESLGPLITDAVDAICSEPVIALEQGGRVWSLVSSYAKTMVDDGKWNAAFSSRTRAKFYEPPCNANRASFVRVVAFDEGLVCEPMCVAVEEGAARVMWLRMLTLCAASPKELVTDASVVRAFRVAQCVDERSLVPHAGAHEAAWSNMLYNEHLLAACSDAAIVSREAALARKAEASLGKAMKRLKRQQGPDGETFLQWWERQVNLSEGLSPDGREPPPMQEPGRGQGMFTEPGERAVRALYSGYMYAAYVVSQERMRGAVVRFGAESSEQVVRLALETTPEKLAKLAARTHTTKAQWPVPASDVEEVFQTALLACDAGQIDTNDVAKFMRVMGSEVVARDGWQRAEERVALALPGCPFAARLARDLWCADKLLQKFHGQTPSHGPYERLVQCTGVDGLDNAIEEATRRRMPLQVQILLHLRGQGQGGERWVTVRLRDTEQTRPSALQIMDTVRASCPGAEDSCVVVGGTRDDAPGKAGKASPVAVAMPERVWTVLTVGETALFHSASPDLRFTPACGRVVSEALEKCPGHGLRALRGLLGLPGVSGPFAEPEDRVVRRLDAVLGMYAKSAQHLVQIIWNALSRGDGDAFWSILELCLCPSAKSLFIAVSRVARPSDVPQWLSEQPRLWEAFFSCPEPSKGDDCWGERDLRNSLPEPRKLYGVVGAPFPMAQANLQSPFPAQQAVLRACLDPPSETAHWECVDAVIRSGTPAAKRWLRCLRAVPGSARDKTCQNLFILPKEARSPVPVAPKEPGIATECEAKLPGLPVSASAFAFFLPIVASVFAQKQAAPTLNEAVEACGKALAGQGQGKKRQPGAVNMGIVTGQFPLRSSFLVGSLRDARSSGFSSVVARSGRVVRPFADALPGSVEGALNNFQWTRKMVCSGV